MLPDWIASFFFLDWYRGRDLNPHSHHWPKDFKSFVSTDSTTAAIDFYGNRLQRYCYFLKYANKNDFLRIFFVPGSKKHPNECENDKKYTKNNNFCTCVCAKSSNFAPEFNHAHI